jgi:hypothetical protein
LFLAPFSFNYFVAFDKCGEILEKIWKELFNGMKAYGYLEAWVTY